MFLVSGTKRSGTSMWMQAFVAANVEVIGQAFPKRWGDGALREANPDGFYESIYRDGVFFGTNPHPDTGEYVRPEATRDRVVKVFVPGVVRTELGFIGGVVANVRRWRDYEASVARLWALEDRQRATESPDEPAPPRLPGALEWWAENFSLLRDHNLDGVLQSWKSFTAHEINRRLKRTGAFWQRDYFDRLIRSRKHFDYCVNYIRENPVKARLRAGSFLLWSEGVPPSQEQT